MDYCTALFQDSNFLISPFDVCDIVAYYVLISNHFNRELKGQACFFISLTFISTRSLIFGEKLSIKPAFLHYELNLFFEFNHSTKIVRVR